MDMQNGVTLTGALLLIAPVRPHLVTAPMHGSIAKFQKIQFINNCFVTLAQQDGAYNIHHLQISFFGSMA